MHYFSSRMAFSILSQFSVLCIILIFTSTSLGATTEQHSLEWMCDRSQLIVHGRITSQTVFEEKGLIWTTYEVEAIEALKNADRATSTLQVTQVGGSLGGRTLHVSGIPHFSEGQEVLLFARDYGTGRPTCVNGAQGGLQITRVGDERSGVVRLAPAALRYYPEVGSANLDSLLAEIRRVLSESRSLRESKSDQ